MPLLLESAIFYALIGGGGAVAVYLRSESTSIAAAFFIATSAVLFWPVDVPLLLASSHPDCRKSALGDKRPGVFNPPKTLRMQAVDHVAYSPAVSAGFSKLTHYLLTKSIAISPAIG
jgi:hypothetical protein